MDMNGMNAPQSKGLAIASMVFGILALVFSCCYVYVAFPLGLVAVILGGVSIAKKQGGKGMAIAGLVCGIIALVLAIIFVALGAALLSYLNI